LINLLISFSQILKYIIKALIFKSRLVMFSTNKLIFDIFTRTLVSNANYIY